jgi:very-short-patch-repair endonuclease
MNRTKKITEEEINNIIKLYQIDNISTHKIGEIFHLGHKKIKQILQENGITVKRKTIVGNGKLPDIKKYDDGKNYIAIHKETKKIFNDYANISGSLTAYLLKLNPDMEIPSSFKRRAYYALNGSYWHEQFYDIMEVKKEMKKTKKCKYCNWSTIDIDNKSGAYKSHLLKYHNISIEDYLKEFPEEIEFFKKDKAIQDFEKNENEWVKCEICGKKLKRIDWRHLSVHNITLIEYKEKYGYKNISNTLFTKLSDNMKVNNANNIMYANVSLAEKEIKNFLELNGIEVISGDRTILNGKELDILIEDKKLAIEYNGNKWHTEWFGKKNKNYHIDKTLAANEAGYSLIHIFEDEFINNKQLIFEKLKYILHIDLDKKIKIGARKCIIKEINGIEFKTFMNKYHLQGECSSTVYIGAFYNNELVGASGFTLINNKQYVWDLKRFAVNYNYIIPGLCSRFIKKLITNHNVRKIVSFADRRWTLDKDNNLYTKIGFSLAKIISPDYRYYNDKIDPYKRFHKFMFRKQVLAKKYNLDINLTETEMVKILGYDRIWDCGLFKYEMKIEYSNIQ